MDTKSGPCRFELFGKKPSLENISVHRVTKKLQAEERFILMSCTSQVTMKRRDILTMLPV